jgi:beta-xylosidase
MKPTPKFRRIVIVVILLACFLMFGSQNLTKAIPIGDYFVDDFSSTVLNSQWSWIGEEPSLWSLTANPGYMRLSTQAGAGTNFLVLPMPTGDFMVETHVFAEPLFNFQNAGLILYLANGSHLTLIRAKCSFCGVGDGNGIFFDHVSDGVFVNPNYGMALSPDNEAYLKIVKQGNVYTGFVSANGVDWTLVGSHIPAFTPQYMGLRASNNGEGDPINADFDYFKYVVYPYHQYLPLLIR